jgi:outer membrane receptor protein involved in Fe transport
LIGAVAAGCGAAGAARAQPIDPQAAFDEIIVTGTRIRRDDFNSPTPTAALDADDLEAMGIVNIGDALMQLPQNVNTNSPTTGAGWTQPGGAFFAGAMLANLRGLNPFFGSRTLTLVDSRRHVPTNQGDGVDLNFIPMILSERVEVVTGGASASYGSGAIAGVTNVLLDRGLDGIRARVDFGRTEGGDDDAYGGVAFGTPVGQLGHLVFGVEHQQAAAIPACSQARGWCALGYGTIANPRFPDGQNPQFVRTEGLRQSWNSHNGIFYIPAYGGRVPNTDAVVPLEVTPAGTGLQDWQTGSWGDGAGNGNPNTAIAIGGSGEGIYDDTTMRTDVDRASAYLAFTYDVSDRLGFFFDVSGGSVESFSPSQSVEANGGCLRADYAYLPQNLAAQSLFTVPANRNCRAGVPPSQPFNGILTKKNWENQLDTYNLTTTDLLRSAFGFDGQIGGSMWTWEAYYQYGQSERLQYINDLRAVTRYLLAFDAVLDSSGNPVCRSIRDDTLPPGYPPADALALRNGCTPLNIFGQAPLSEAVQGYAFGFVREDTTVEQQIIEATVSGPLFDGFGAGPISLAAGLSLRAESIANIAAEELSDALRRDVAVQYGDSFSGEVDVLEYFAEIDLPFFERFNLNVAARRSEYANTAGAGTGIEGQEFDHEFATWKVGGQWDIVDSVALRFSRSRDARAPNFRELYYRQVSAPGGFFCMNPWMNNLLEPCIADLRGEPGLVPEESDTLTLGLVVAPRGRSVRFAVDYYEITIDDALTSASSSRVIEGCYRGDQSLCNEITGTTMRTLSPTSPIPCPATCFSDIEGFVSTAFNFRRYHFSGVDFSADWIKTLKSGNLQLRLLANRTLHQRIWPNVNNASETYDLAGTTGAPTQFVGDWAAAADLTASVMATWRRDNFSITGHIRYVADGVNDLLLVGPDDPRYDITVPRTTNQTVNVNTVPSYEVYTLSGSYDFALAGDRSLQLYGVINNLLDEDPPLIGGSRGFSAGGVGGAQPQFFDTMGRTYRVGVRMEF